MTLDKFQKRAKKLKRDFEKLEKDLLRESKNLSPENINELKELQATICGISAIAPHLITFLADTRVKMENNR